MYRFRSKTSQPSGQRRIRMPKKLAINANIEEWERWCARNGAHPYSQEALVKAALYYYPHLGEVLPWIKFVDQGNEPVTSGGMPTFASSADMQVYWSKAAMQAWLPHNKYGQFHPSHLIADMVAHEIWGHILGGSYLLLGGKDPEHWNRGEDCRINCALPALAATGLTLHPKQYELPENQSGEFYYYNIPRPPEGKAGQTGTPSGDSQPGNDQEEDGEQEPPSGHGGITCGGGSSVHGRRQPWERPRTDGVKVPSKEQLWKMRKAVAEKILQDRRYRGTGLDTAGMRKWAEDLLYDEKASMVVREFVDFANDIITRGNVKVRRTSSKYGIRSLNPIDVRQTIIRGYIVPTYWKRSARILVIGDTSLSMTDDHTQAAVSGAIDGLIKAAGLEGKSGIPFIPCDTMAYGPYMIHNWKEALQVAKGGGGTDLTPALKLAQRIPHDVVFVITNGDFHWPTEPPGERPVHVLLTDGDRQLPRWVASKHVLPARGEIDF